MFVAMLSGLHVCCSRCKSQQTSVNEYVSVLFRSVNTERRPRYAPGGSVTAVMMQVKLLKLDVVLVCISVL